MLDDAILNVIRGADPADAEDLSLRAALAAVLRSIDEPPVDRQQDCEDCRIA
jgi:hypothetical protein